MHWLRRFFYYRPFADRTLCHFLRWRLSLPSFSLPSLFDDCNQRPVTITQMPRGGWSTPIADIVMLAKIAVCAGSKRVLEVGSFRGHTALMLAQHTEDTAKIVTVDRYPEHGEAYQGTKWAEKIDRRIGETTPEMFAGDVSGSYDLIFVDADHSYEGVKRDTELVLRLVAPNGYLVWHDYANWGYFDKKNGVPEYLKELASRELQIAHINGCDLAVYSPGWGQEGTARDRFLRAIKSEKQMGEVGVDPWTSETTRG
jgi:predicted O-methyltransferase YrrM